MTRSRFKTFVANRLAIIQEQSSVDDWKHIEGKLNPADLASRGFMPSEEDLLREWLDGPRFFKKNKYPEETTTEKAPDDDYFDNRVRRQRPCSDYSAIQ